VIIMDIVPGAFSREAGPWMTSRTWREVETLLDRFAETGLAD
jgi:hypothetical protein